jgi:hypothetical protein
LAAYSFLDRLLHRAALQFSPIAELSFDLDQKVAASDPRRIVRERHVFISGLARAGTTILMRRFYATGAYCSLTYRNMPFVLAPNIWRRFVQLSKRTVEAAERAHGDRILVDVDSPESLDEVFWRVFDGEGYIAEAHLKPHDPEDETTAKYVSYVGAILSATSGPGTRYLSKNNNNILRLKSIRQAFPQAIILIPFREPLSHVGSLLRQHRNFVETQRTDRFVKSYMTWLAHHEFGLDHRPFRFDDEGAKRLAAYQPEQIDYWIELWRQTYGWLEHSAPKDAIFVCYEDLCRNADVWSRLAEISGVENVGEEHDAFSLSRVSVEAPANADLTEQAAAIYERLVDRACASLQ